MLPTDSTWIRHEVKVTGVKRVTSCAPSLETFDANGDQLIPPSVESRMFTAAATLPPPTFHVTVNGPDGIVSPPFGYVTSNGAPMAVMVISSQAWAPASGCWSRATSRKCIDRSDLGSFSHLSS